MSLCQIWNDAPNDSLKTQCRLTIWEYHEILFLPRTNRFCSQKGDQSDGSCVLSYSRSADFVSLFIPVFWNQGMPIILPFFLQGAIIAEDVNTWTVIRIAKSENEFLPSNLRSIDTRLSFFVRPNPNRLVECNNVIVESDVEMARDRKGVHLVELRWWGGKILLWTNTRCEPQLQKSAETEAPQCGVQ